MPVRLLDLKRSVAWRGVTLRFGLTMLHALCYRCHVRAVSAVAKGELGGRRQVRAAPRPWLNDRFTHTTNASTRCGHARLTKVR
jgi:hypothetical protein